MKKTFLIIALLLNVVINAQIKNIYSGKVDSIIIKNYSYHDKETSTVNEAVENTTTQLLNSTKIKQKKIKKLGELLKLDKSYFAQRALLSHFNKKIEYFLNGKKIQDITISTLTKNITIYKGDKCVFKAEMSPFLEKEILNLEK